MEFENPKLPKRFVTVIRNEFDIYGNQHKLTTEKPGIVSDADIIRWHYFDLPNLSRLPAMGKGTTEIVLGEILNASTQKKRDKFAERWVTSGW